MTTVDPRWTAETKMLVRRHIASACAAIATAPGTASPYDISIERAERLLAALADASLLVEPGGTTQQRWKVEWYDIWPHGGRRRRTRVMATEQEADHWLAQCKPEESPRKFRRVMHVGPFVEVPS